MNHKKKQRRKPGMTLSEVNTTKMDIQTHRKKSKKENWTPMKRAWNKGHLSRQEKLYADITANGAKNSREFYIKVE